VVCYCRLSHRATIAWIAMTHILDYSNVKIYDGSWTEWGSIVGYPSKNDPVRASAGYFAGTDAAFRIGSQRSTSALT